ncbi:hypothetical protein FEZ60_26960 [Rhodococcus sp. MS16]|jgi:hypothetical protein|uniref:hypothetical protein n=1 Tax=Rhodococcus sp. MS16 TaxID=2579941 RepID=UPI0015629AD0|nr:hypothetical protein [Rhodococcus sp. MS16]NRI69169.1 hypothetical protein [Rhodococcus sp. MS16]
MDPIVWAESDERESWWREVLGIDVAEQCVPTIVVEQSQRGLICGDQQRRGTDTSVAGATAA